MTESESESEPEAPEVSKPAVWLRVRAVVLWGVVGTLALLVPIATRVVIDGRAALAQAHQVDDDDDLRVELLGRAGRWRMPGFDHDDEALRELFALGDAAEARGQGAQALAAFREARRAIMATRAWGVPHRDLLVRANERIATLMAQREAADHTDVGGQGDPYAYHLQLLQAEPGPDPVRANLAALAFIGWLIASVAFVLRGVDEHGRLRSKPATRWGIAVLALLIAWCVLLATAG